MCGYDYDGGGGGTDAAPIPCNFPREAFWYFASQRQTWSWDPTVSRPHGLLPLGSGCTTQENE